MNRSSEPVPPEFARAAARYLRPLNLSLADENRRIDAEWQDETDAGLGAFWREAQECLAERVRMTLRYR